MSTRAFSWKERRTAKWNILPIGSFSTMGFSLSGTQAWAIVLFFDNIQIVACTYSELRTELQGNNLLADGSTWELYLPIMGPFCVLTSRRANKSLHSVQFCHIFFHFQAFPRLFNRQIDSKRESSEKEYENQNFQSAMGFNFIKNLTLFIFHFHSQWRGSS